jgi:hypothetical protein
MDGSDAPRSSTLELCIMRLFALMVSVWWSFPAILVAQGPTERVDRVVGRVVTDSGRALAGASILVTRAPDRAVFVGSSDLSGEFAVAVPNGTGDYLVYISAPGYTSFRRRATRIVTTDTFVRITATLSLVAAQQLSTINVRASPTPPRPQRRSDLGTQAGAAEVLVDDFAAAVPPESSGDLTAVASSIPGVVSRGVGNSVLGLDPSQNMVTLNGLAFSAALPRAATVSTRVTTTTFDPARGWFSGANTNVEFAGGGVFHLRTGYATLDAPFLQLSDPVSRTLGQQLSAGNVSVGASGPLGRRDRVFFNTAVQAGRRARDLPSLFGMLPDALPATGVAADSVGRLRMVLQDIGLGGTDPRERSVTDGIGAIMRFDYDPRPVQSLEPAKRAGSLTLFGNASRAGPLLTGFRINPFGGSRRSTADAGLQATWSSYWGPQALTTVRSGVSYAREATSPQIELPGASVAILSDLPDNTGGLSTFSVGGDPPQRKMSRWTWESTSETQWYHGRTDGHRLTATGALRVDGLDDPGIRGQRATFHFLSLTDLANGTPSSFQLTTGVPRRAGAVANAFASLGDLWRVSRTLRVQYGLRAEANRYLVVPEKDAAVTQAFGVRREFVPDTWRVSPRVGFTWTWRGDGNVGALAVNQLGAFNLKPTSYLRGGIGEFRSMMPVSLLNDALIDINAQASARNVTCLGEAAPKPAWRTYLLDPMNVPRGCASSAGSGAAGLIDSTPRVALVSPAYTAPRSWRANLGYESQFHWITFSVEGTYSINLHQQDRVDLNLAERVAFRTLDEGRPVLAPLSAIVPTSGLIPLPATRREPGFGSVLMTRADGRSVSRQLIVSLAPTFEHARRGWAQVSYVLSEARARQSGFVGTTFSAPWEATWARAPGDVRHQFVIRGGLVIRGVTLSLFGRASAGETFTPIVGSDVNGDGFVNDRAVVRATATVGGPTAWVPALGEALLALRAASPAARRCLDGQQAGIAAPASCAGPWTTALNVQLSVTPRRLQYSGRVPTVRLNVANLLSGLDQLFHGAERLRGWGSASFPDPVLYTVRGFNTAQQRFEYEINPRFASARTGQALARMPFRVTLDVRFDLTPSLPRQQLTRYLAPGRGGRPGSKLTVTQLQQRYAREVVDPYRAILVQSDSLLLQRAQIEALQAAHVRYRRAADSAWLKLATTFAALPDSYDAREALRQQERAIEEVRELTRIAVRATLGGILDPIQLRLMPSEVNRLFRAERPLTRAGRTFYNR